MKLNQILATSLMIGASLALTACATSSNVNKTPSSIE